MKETPAATLLRLYDSIYSNIWFLKFSALDKPSGFQKKRKENRTFCFKFSQTSALNMMKI